jgi:hypothetical protein
LPCVCLKGCSKGGGKALNRLISKIRVKDMDTPSTIARGLNFPSPAELARTAGRRGRMQGDRILRTPAPNATTGEIAS